MPVDANSNVPVVLSEASIDAIREELETTKRFMATLDHKPCKDSAIVWYEEWLKRCQLENDLKKIGEGGEP